MTSRMSIEVRGAVQGVGFRPFVYRLAQEHHLNGWVINTPEGVGIEVEGEETILREFPLRIRSEKPACAHIYSMQQSIIDPVGYADFRIRESTADGVVLTTILPDIATCGACLRELFDPSDRRYLYPFTNCTHCGPRYSIIEGLPYDRAMTTMRRFTMCAACQAEYDNPSDRRFHAQPNACPVCGPRTELLQPDGTILALGQDAILHTVAILKQGGIVALKGLGGFHLLVDAGNSDSVQRLRNRKHREEKPFALMFPDINAVSSCCHMSHAEEQMLQVPEAPIVLLRVRSGNGCVSPLVAPRNPFLGVMLPYTPLHHILLREHGQPVVATSGNLSDETICTDNREALDRLGGIADVFLVHDRPIARHVDDSIVRFMCGRQMMLRRARGFAPLPVALDTAPKSTFLAMGGQLKNTVAFNAGSNVMISQHIGDLDGFHSELAFERTIDTLCRMYRRTPDHAVVDMHPDYRSTKFASLRYQSVIPVQHHVAHIASCMAENRLEDTVLGVAWDGTGYGDDGSIWGSEFFLTDGARYRRVASLHPFQLPGGDTAIRQPRRIALALLFEMFGQNIESMTWVEPVRLTSSDELHVLMKMLDQNVNSPKSSGMGRLFDAVASLLGIRHETAFEGQAAMELEFAAAEGVDSYYEFGMDASNNEWRSNDAAGEHHDRRVAMTIIDWRPTVAGILEDLRSAVPVATIAARFHNTLTEIICTIAQQEGNRRVVLSGGCFQNVFLAERVVQRLTDEGFSPYWHQRIPPNDGGISLGQMYAAMKMMTDTEDA